MVNFLIQKFSHEFLGGHQIENVGAGEGQQQYTGLDKDLRVVTKHISVNLTLLIISFGLVFVSLHLPNGKFLPFCSPDFVPT
jgi:hypothetical protein